MADKRLTYVLTARDDASLVFKKVAAEGEASSKKISKSSQDASKNLKLLSTAIAAIGPAAVPIAAAAVPALLGLGGAAGAALLSFKGLSDQWKQGTLQAQPLGQQISALQNNLHGMEAVSATAIGPGLTDGLKKINALTPMISQDMEKLSGQLGEIAGHTGAALADLFVRLNPLFVSLGDQLVKGSISFEHWAGSSSQVTKFVTYAQQQLPTVEHLIGNLVTTIQHLIVGIAPLGGGSLTTLKLFSQTINLIPVGVLQVLAPAIAGLKVAQTASAAVNNLTGSFKKLKDMDIVSKLGSALSDIPFGPVGIAIGGVALAAGAAAVALHLFGHHAHETVKPVQELTDAIQQDSGAFRENTRQQIVNTLQQKGLYDAGLKLGIGQRTLTDAILGNAHAAQIVADAIDSAHGKTGALQKASATLAGALPYLQDQLFASKHAADNEAAAMGNLSGRTATAAYATSQLRNAIAGLQNKTVTVQEYINTINSVTNVQTMAGSHDSHRALGGPVSAGVPYIVGEHGPELMVPGTSGTVIPNNRMGGGGFTVNVYVAGSVTSEKRLTAAVTQAIRQDLRARGKSGTALML